MTFSLKVLSLTTCIFLFSYSITKCQNVDIDWLRKINLERNKNLDGTFSVISSSMAPVSIGIPVSVFGISLITKDKQLRNKSIYIASSVAANVVLTTALKYSLNRDRPFITYPELEKLSDGGSPSFPSGHTSTSFALATSISLVYPKWYVIVPSFTWAGLVAYSRMDLGVHYPSDVLAGVVIGVGTAYLAYKLEKKYLKL